MYADAVLLLNVLILLQRLGDNAHPQRIVTRDGNILRAVRVVVESPVHRTFSYEVPAKSRGLRLPNTHASTLDIQHPNALNGAVAATVASPRIELTALHLLLLYIKDQSFRRDRCAQRKCEEKQNQAPHPAIDCTCALVRQRKPPPARAKKPAPRERLRGAGPTRPRAAMTRPRGKTATFAPGAGRRSLPHAGCSSGCR